MRRTAGVLALLWVWACGNHRERGDADTSSPTARRNASACEPMNIPALPVCEQKLLRTVSSISLTEDPDPTTSTTTTVWCLDGRPRARFVGRNWDRSFDVSFEAWNALWYVVENSAVLCSSGPGQRRISIVVEGPSPTVRRRCEGARATDLVDEALEAFRRATWRPDPPSPPSLGCEVSPRTPAP